MNWIKSYLTKVLKAWTSTNLERYILCKNYDEMLIFPSSNKGSNSYMGGAGMQFWEHPYSIEKK
jgi:hypothetical protein